MKRENYYVYGNTAPVIRPQIDEPLRRERRTAPSHVSAQTRKNREKAKSMNPGVVFLFGVVMMVFCLSLMGELSLQAKNTELRRDIAARKSELNTIKMENDEEYDRIMASVDMQAIKERAITELGMQYAQSGQVIVVADATDDYVHQYKDLP